jgi:hypothetical protein
MGQAKHREIKAQDDWTAKAKREGYACSICTRTPEYDERDIYFRTGKCSFCASGTAERRR